MTKTQTKTQIEGDMCFCYSLREMNVRRLTCQVALLLLALTLPGISRVANKANDEPSQRRAAPQRSLQSFALSDFDADGLLDEARLDGSAVRETVRIRLSGAGKRSFLHFDAARPVHGSLLAQDIDNDGATDLIWSNPFRANDAVVWLGDGNGRFVEVDSSQYAAGLAVGNTAVAEPDEQNQETAINFETNQSLDQPLSSKFLDKRILALPNDYPDRLQLSSPALDQPTGRAPPFSRF